MSNTQVVGTESNTVVESPKAPSKADIARGIFAEMQGATRKDVIARFMSEARLTKAGAATYYQNFKAKAKAGK